MTLDRNETDQFVRRLLNTINTYGADKNSPSLSAFEPYFAPEFTMARNRLPFCSSSTDFIGYINGLQQQLIKFKYNYKPKLLTIDTEEENRAAIYYEITASHPQDKKIFCRVSANLWIVEGKVREWREVLYTTGVCTQIFTNS